MPSLHSLPAIAGMFIAVTPSDSAGISGGLTRGLYVGAGGNVAVTDNYGNTVTFVGVPTGTFMPIQVTKVMATNTTAASILALY